MPAQQFEVCETVRDISRGSTGVREPMLNVSAASNNRTGSFIGRNLTPTRIFQTRILDLPLMDSAASTLSKFSAKILQTKNGRH
jgi:hypothetical protein